MAGPSGAVLVTGASGLVGSRLSAGLARDGRDVVALSRRAPPSDLARGVRGLQGDVGRAGDWMRAIDGADAVVHLAGEPVVGGRWTAARKQRLVASRVDSTDHVVAGIEAARVRPAVLVCASAVGYYGPRGEQLLAEDAPPGHDFLARLCIAWEAAARRAEVHGVRVVCLRFGVVLSRRGGAFPRLALPFRLGLGGRLGPGGRFFPWLHDDDADGLIRRALDGGTGALQGAVNAVAPEAVRMRELAAAIARALHRPALLPVPLVALRLVLGEAASALVPGQRVTPRAALAAGYEFRHPSLAGALQALVDR